MHLLIKVKKCPSSSKAQEHSSNRRAGYLKPNGAGLGHQCEPTLSARFSAMAWRAWASAVTLQAEPQGRSLNPPMSCGHRIARSHSPAALPPYSQFLHLLPPVTSVNTLGVFTRTASSADCSLRLRFRCGAGQRIGE
jgi:hypothetical protein